MARWLKLVLGLCAAMLALAIWAAYMWTPGLQMPPEDAALREYRRAESIMWNRLRGDRTLLARKIRIDTLRPMLADTGVAIAVANGLRPDVASDLEQTIRAELAAVGALNARIGVFIVPGDRHGGTMDELWHGADVEYYGSLDSSEPACIVAGADDSGVVPDSTTPFDDRVRIQGTSDTRVVREDILGACSFWARHGAPGQGMAAWLRSGAMVFALRSTETTPLADSVRHNAETLRYDRRPLPFCRANYPDQCRESLLEREATGRFTPADYLLGTVGANGYYNYERRELTGMLAAIEREYGRERFARFWKADANVETAFTAAFGEPIESWAIRWSRAIWGPENRGPRMGIVDIALTLLVAGVLCGMAMQLSRRRQV